MTVNFKNVYDSFLRNPSSLGLMTVFKNHNAWDNSNIVFEDGQIVVYDKKNKIKGMDCIDYGLGILKKRAFDTMADRDVFDLSEIYQDIISKKLMCGYEAPERFYEIGSLSGLAETEQYILTTKNRR